MIGEKEYIDKVVDILKAIIASKSNLSKAENAIEILKKECKLASNASNSGTCKVIYNE